MKEFFLKHKKAILISLAVIAGLVIIAKLRGSSSGSSGQVIDTGGYGGITLATPTGTGATSFGSNAVNTGGSTVPGTTGTVPHTKKPNPSASAKPDAGSATPSVKTGSKLAASTMPYIKLPPGTHIQ